MASVRAVKGVKFYYQPTPQTVELLKTFRDMVNYAIHICLEENIHGRFWLRNRIYREFQKKYAVTSRYPYSVAEVAWSIVKKHRRWQRRPVATRLMLKMDAYNYSLNYAVLSLPFKKGERILIPLKYRDYQRSFLMDKTVKRGSVTMTERNIIISFSKEMALAEPMSKVGFDTNEKSIVGSDGTRYDLSEEARLHTEYGVRRSDFYSKHSDDRRLKQKFASSRREKERMKQFLHKISKDLVEKAKEQRQAIVLERLKGIRYSHRKGNGEGRERRRRIALWPFRQLQDYIEYKAKWEGVPVEYVNPSRTSQTCHLCNFVDQRLKLSDRVWLCPNCGATLDRDLNAAINIERRGKIECLGVVRPEAQGIDEAMKQERNSEGPNPVAEAPKLGE